jgi:phosphonoacetate hydrolase
MGDPEIMARKIFILLIDGGDPQYFEHAEVPNFRRIGAGGFWVTGSCVIPSVTNVNNASVMTASFPRDHGITGNFCYDPATGDGTYMESADFLARETLFQRAKRLGMSTALFTSKIKLKKLLERDADIAVAGEDPPADLVAKVGPKCEIYSLEVNWWVLEAARIVMREQDPDLVYVSTTDYIMHKFPPEHEMAQRHLEGLDRIIGRIADEQPHRELYITADHGMSAKHRAVNLTAKLAKAGVRAVFVPVIKDKYVVHHDNLGGVGYLYLHDPSSLGDAIDALKAVPGVEEVYRREAAAEQFGLMAERIGDLFVLGAPEVVFGDIEGEEQSIDIRSHGSHHEAAIPIIGSVAKAPAHDYRYNLDIARHLQLA